jgi:hypothetical protein
MKFDDLLKAIANEPVFETGLLLAGNVDSADVRRQLSRWVKSGRLLQIRRGLYALASPYQKTIPHPFLVANRLVRGSYVSMQSAMSYHGLIPEGVTSVTSVTTGRPMVYETPLGRYEFHHIKPDFLQGFRLTELGNQQAAFLAVPEKALLDLVHLTPRGDEMSYLHELRLQGTEGLCPEELLHYSVSPKLRRAVEFLLRSQSNESEGFETL